MIDDNLPEIPASNPDIEDLRAYAIARARKDQIDVERKALKAKLAELEPIALAAFENIGVTQAKIKTDPSLPKANYTLSLRTEHWPKKAKDVQISASELQRLFQEGGLGEFCEPRMNVQGLRAHFTEQMKQQQERARAEKRNALEIDPMTLVPVPLQGVLEFRTVHKVGARKA